MLFITQKKAITTQAVECFDPTRDDSLMPVTIVKTCFYRFRGKVTLLVITHVINIPKRPEMVGLAIGGHSNS